MKYLLYTLVNYNSKYYLQIFRQFLKALLAFSDLSKFDLCIVTDAATLPDVQKLRDIKSFPSVSYVIVPVDKSLHTALFRKFDITQHPNFMHYDAILFLDCDIIVQNDVLSLFAAVKPKPNKLYVAQEGDLAEYYWRINALKNTNISRMRREHIQSFNSGAFMFKPTQEMKAHFESAKQFGLEYQKSHKFFYDQPIFNYYFNTHKIAKISKYLTDKLQMFPDVTKYYPNKTLMHISGIGNYKTKAPTMRAYLDFIKKSKLRS